MELRMAEHAVWCFIFLLTLLEVVVKTKMTIHGNSHAFMQANNEVRYLVDGIAVSPMHKDFSSSSGVRVPSLEENSMYNNKLHLKFDPPLLDFKERHLGMPHHEKVTLFNVNNNKTIHMSSISGNTVHFHSSFFEDKIIPPLGNTSFNVVFLGREEGEIESNLFIHTSEGSFKYQVKGASVSSPYRLRPLVGVRVPLNSTYSPLIYMHNPHTTPMQIVEVYSSGGEFHLELPSGELEGPKHLWEIPPFHTKPVIRIRFVAKAEKNHTAYIRIKVNKSEEVLVVPLEVEVAPHAGLYSPDDVLDFGIGGSRDKPKEVRLLLYNSWKKMIRIQNIITTPVSKALKIDFQPVKVPPDSKSPTQVAVLTFDWKASFESKHFSGKLVIKSKQSQHKVVIPYIAHVLEGGLEFNASVTQYCSDLGLNLGVRNFTVTNAFKIPVALVNVSLPKEAQAHFTIQNFSPTILAPGEKVVLFQLTIKKETIESELKLESNLLLHTNISTVSIPLLCYNGRLMKVILSGFNESELNFGTVGSTSQKEAHFAVVNNNPVAVLLKSWGTNMTGALVELVGVEEGNRSTVLQRHSFSNMSTTLVLMPGHYAVFRVFVEAPKTEGAILAEVFVKTQFERVVIPARMTVAHGNLEVLPESLVLDDCFPGKLCMQQLQVRSLFNREMDVTSITSVPPDPQVSYEYRKERDISSTLHVARISPLNTSSIGELRFNPAIGCRNQCYLGISPNSTIGSQWLHTLGLPIHAQDTDLTLLNTRHNRYLALTDGASSAWHNLTLRMDTTEVRGHTFQTRVRLTWPRLVSTPQIGNTSVVTFPLTQIGNTTYKDIVLHNPSSKAVVIQLVLDCVYPQGNRLLDNLPDRFRPDCKECSSSVPGEFTWVEGAKAGAMLQNQLGVPVHRDSFSMLLQPGETVHTKLGLKPVKAGPISALIYVRNNLTILEVVQVSGQAAHAQFKFGNRKPGSGTPLLFELAEKHLKDCEREKHRKFPVPNLTVKRSFTARNTGDLPIHVTGFNINGLSCEGYGFRILNCVPFHLPPNGTRKIDIAFTPDFTLARIQRTLSIDTSLGIPVNYTLITTLPPYFLASCSSVLGRPSWEPLLYYSAISFMAFLLFCVLAAAFLESDRILKCALMAMARDRAARVPPDSKQNSPGQKGADKPCSTKQDGTSDWNLGSSVQHTEKHIKGSHSSNVGICSKNNSCTVPDDRNISETDTKDRSVCTKYDEPEGGYSNSSTPLLTIKNRKKLGKRNSNNSDASSLSESLHDIPVFKKGWTSMFSRSSQGSSSVKSKQVETENRPTATAANISHSTDTEPSSKKNIDSSKDGKRINRAFKKNKSQPEPIICSEEETSSTTTESSNNDEVDKERETSCEVNPLDRPHKTIVKKGKDKSSADYRDNYEGDCDDDDYERDAHKRKDFSSRWKSTHKTTTVKSNQQQQQQPQAESVANKMSTVGSSEISRPPSLELPYKLKSSKSTSRDRKDKNVLKRRTTDKTGNSKGPTLAAESNSLGSSSVRVSPPLRSSHCWGEQRASFSDVVARNDSPLYSSIVAPRKRTQQSSQVPVSLFADSSSSSSSTSSNNGGNNSRKLPEPTTPTNTSTGLGPIGPKKTSSSSSWEVFGEVPSTSSQFLSQQDPSNLFISGFPDTSQSLQVDEALETPPFATEIVWEQQGAMMGRMQGKKQAEDYQCQQQNAFRELWPPSLWDPLYTPAVADNTLYPTATTSEEVPATSGSVWGSFMNSVWSSSPWSTGTGSVAPSISAAHVPIVPPAPIPTPRHEVPNNIEEDNAADIDQGLGFDPFRSLNNIWSPRSTENWSPPSNE
ncbi:transmembrane protein 131 isoform X2 [Periplaneta americana]|uniref:transmembrane protein 131 isoform X2 n=1 Tax=Periplaneta americana TaxID=6978 RepID=UPI0037E9181B